ncbi:hypothetical protein ACFFK0_02670 [Paenibacillus chartarius]|uniref:Uncharacterized protein n=1 Tax=Paenibacillus chartarius TaxID=747481 RepID=A0ABV6DFD7_9BACL
MERYPSNGYHSHEERHHPERRPTPQPSKAWYQQGWLWMIMAMIGISVIGLGLFGLADQAAELNNSVKEQTDVLREQNGLLAGIRESADHIAGAVRHGFGRVVDAIQSAADRIAAG